MFNPYNKQNDALERFRIKAHLRSYVKDPVIIDEALLAVAVNKLKKLPYKSQDPADSVAIELLLDAYRLAYYKDKDLTVSGLDLVKFKKHHRQTRTHKKLFQSQIRRNRYTLKTI